MQWFKNFRTSAKILFLVFLMLLLIMVISFSGYRASALITEHMRDMYENYAEPAMMISDARSLSILNRYLVISLVYAADINDMKAYTEEIYANRKRVNELLDKYEKTDIADEERRFLTELEAAQSAAREKQDEAIALGMDLKNAEKLGARLRRGGDIDLAQKKMMELYMERSQALIKSCENSYMSALRDAGVGMRSIMFYSVTTILTGILCGILISRMITGPVAQIQKSVKLFSEGDLLSAFPSEGKDELAATGRELQKMAVNLKNIIGSVKSAGGEIAHAALEFSSLAGETKASVEGFHSRADQMSTNLEALASTGEEVNASVQEVAAGAQATAQKGTDIARQVDDAMSAGESGMSAVRRAVNGIEKVANQASETAQSVQELGERARQIQNFVTQIGGIADQTNLLALNAAIEAARAGEAGRGFAVVAEEVRKLAEDSNVAAKSIQELAKTITDDLDHVVSVSVGNAQASQEAKELSKETEGTIGVMIASLENISGGTQDLAAVSEEQAASSAEIAEAVQNIAAKVADAAETGELVRKGAGEVASAAEKIEDRAGELSQLSVNLQKLLAFFKIGDEEFEGKRFGHEGVEFEEFKGGEFKNGGARKAQPEKSRRAALPPRRNPGE
jgi:methyl-accepting chemotaxis protein